MKLLSNSLAFGLGALIGSQSVLRVAVATQPFPMPYQFAACLDHPLRLQYRNVSETLGLFGFAAGMNVLDLGCGTGLFTEEMARMVGATGVVHALDLQQPLLNVARRRIEAAGLGDRVRFHHAGAAHLPLADESIDLAILIATLGEIDDKLGALHEVRRVLKVGGRLALSEELLDPAYVPWSRAKSWLEEAGFGCEGKTGNAWCYSALFRC